MTGFGIHIERRHSGRGQRNEKHVECVVRGAYGGRIRILSEQAIALAPMTPRSWPFSGA